MRLALARTEQLRSGRLGHLAIVPAQRPALVDREHEVVTHDRVGAHAGGKDFAQFKDPGPDPVSTVRKVPPGLGIESAQKLAPHATRDTVVVRGCIQGDELTAGHGHGGLTEFGLGNQASGQAAVGL